MKQSLGARTLVFPAPVWVVGTYDQDNKPNVMTAAWGGICCSKPPCLGVSLRPATYSHRAIMDRKAFTISVPSEDHARQADYFGMVSGRDTDKFAASGLTPVHSDLVDAPYIKEFPMVVECRLKETVNLGMHTWFVGEIMDVKVEAEVLGEGGLPDVGKVRPVVFAPEVRTYHGLGRNLGQAFHIGRGIDQQDHKLSQK